MRTMITQALYHVIDTFRSEMLWQADCRDMYIPQAICLVALSTIEMYVQIINVTVAFIPTSGIL